MTQVAITGHRPEKLGDPAWVRAELIRVLAKINPDLLYQGMAAGVDLLAAEVAHELHIPFVACRPWATHAPRKQDEILYRWATDNAVEVVNVSPATTYEGPWLYHNRNHYMADRADMIVAVWDGKPTGGTYACVDYALTKKQLQVVRIDPIRQTVTLMQPKSGLVS